MEDWRNCRVMARKNAILHPFTPSQWQELEEQANIFNCISLGLPIPTHLLSSLKRNRFCQPKLGFLPPYSALRWGSFQLGSSRRVEDPEPGRCRRTDGKKWRCSRVVCPDSKYCERHLHRGKNRLRKCAENSVKNENFVSVLPFSPLSLIPNISIGKDNAFNEPRYCHGVKQSSRTENSELIFKHCFVFDDLRLERSFESEEEIKQKPISLHHFFDERPDKTEKDEKSQCKLKRITEELNSSGSRITQPLPVLLDLNV